MRTIIAIAALGCLSAATALAEKGNPFVRETAAVFSNDAAVRSAAAARLRERGPAALEELLNVRSRLAERAQAVPDDPETRDRMNEQLKRLDEAIDQVGGQRHCSASRLYWYTDLSEAQGVAARTGRPILSLRMLGQLTDDYSCANSRFFRTTLYANEEVSAYLRENFVLHWKSVRPVPRITVDFGDGRKIERTVTGNSAHYALTPDGRVLDALPGLYSPAAFLEWLHRAEHFDKVYRKAAEKEREHLLVAYHARRADQIDESWKADLVQLDLEPSLSSEQLTDEETWRRIAALRLGEVALDAASRRLIRAENPNALQAGRLAVTKSVVEDPLVRLLANLQANIALDMTRNEYRLHRQIHQRLASEPGASSDVDALNEWVYADLFLTPSSDPWLGLAPADTYTALPNGGLNISRSQPE